MQIKIKQVHAAWQRANILRDDHTKLNILNPDWLSRHLRAIDAYRAALVTYAAEHGREPSNV